jgi:pimeloyl-ACP methyl ester carboxylesterase
MVLVYLMLGVPQLAQAQSFDQHFAPPAGATASTRSITAHGTRRDTTYVVYIPDGINTSQKYPCLIGISPNGRGDRALQFMKAACDQYHWIFIGPNQLGPPLPFLALDPMFQDAINSAIREYPIDSSKMFAAGYAGGAMEAQHLAVLLPDKIQGVIANCGVIHGAGLQDPSYPHGKTAVMLASPTDRRYIQMKENSDFLKARNWNINWIEFPGGHKWASSQAYASAVGWLNQQMGSSSFSSTSNHFAPTSQNSAPSTPSSGSPAGF